MQHIDDRDLPCVAENSDIREVIRRAVDFPHTRLIYVIDDQKKLLGVITIGALMRHLYPYHYKDKIHPRDILRNIVVENASHLMSSGNINPFHIKNNYVDDISVQDNFLRPKDSNQE